MEETRYRLVQRVRTVLVELESLSDGRTSGSEHVAGGDTNEVSLQRDKHPFDYFTGQLEGWLGDAEMRVKRERKQERGEPTSLEDRFWFFEEWEGKSAHRVATATGMTIEQVWEKRKRAGRNPEDGRQKKAA